MRYVRLPGPLVRLLRLPIAETRDLRRAADSRLDWRPAPRSRCAAGPRWQLSALGVVSGLFGVGVRAGDPEDEK